MFRWRKKIIKRAQNMLMNSSCAGTFSQGAQMNIRPGRRTKCDSLLVTMGDQTAFQSKKTSGMQKITVTD